MKGSPQEDERRTIMEGHEDDPGEHQAEVPVNTQETTESPQQQESPVNTQENTEPPQQQEIPVINAYTSFEDAGEACVPDSQGRYGSSSGANTQQIQYGYQLEVEPDIPFQIITYRIIPEIERRVSEIVVPLMFEQACSRAGTRRRRLQVDGFTSFPPDKIMPNEQCEGPLSSSENKCHVVQGYATVFSETRVDDEMLQRAREFVAKGMNEGMFDEVHEGLVGISYHDENGVQSTKSTAKDDSKNAAVIWGPIVGVVALGAVIAALFVVRRHYKKKQETKTSDDPLGIRPSTREDYMHREFSQSTKSSWEVLKHSPTAKREELGISPRGLVDTPQHFTEIRSSSWDMLQSPSTQSQLPVTYIEGEKWEDESVLTG